MENLKLFVKGFVTNIIFSAILFISAGKIDFLQGWIFFVTNVIASIMSAISIKDIDIIKERSTIKKDAKSWDKKILALSAVFYLLTIIIAGFDAGRFNWSPDFNIGIFILGAFLILAGNSIFLIAKNQNKFFSAIVRIQTDRGHSVCDKGLYKIVRHPGYLGMSISLIGLPVTVGSMWCFIPILISIVLLLVRTNLEDKTLINELDGYYSYTQKTKYKLIPYIW